MKIKLSLIAILLLAAFLRFYKLSSIPPHLTADEAALGYNAYSILKTGRDEYGQFLPLVFKSFGDYKPGLYVYLTIPFVAILGLTELAVRLPSALAGVASIYLIYLLTQELFPVPRSKRKSHLSQSGKATSPHPPPTPKPQLLPLLTALLLAISPWHLHFSRGGWEANLALTLTLTGIYFFFKAINTKNPKPHKPQPRLPQSTSCKLTLSALFFGLTLLTYQSAKLFTPLIILGLAIFFGKNIWRQLKLKSTIPLLLLGLFALPVFFNTLKDTSGRLQVMSVFSYPRPPQEIRQLVLDQDRTTPDSLSFKLFHPESFNLFRGILGRYFNHFSGRFLFFRGDWSHPAHHPPYFGQLYWLDSLALLVAIYAIANSQKIDLWEKTKIAWHPKQAPHSKNPNLNFLLFWLAISPLPSALSRDSIHAIRSLNLVIPLTIALSLGWTLIIQKINHFKNLLKVVSLCFLLFAFCFNLASYLDSYYLHFPKAASQNFQYGYKQLVQVLQPRIAKGQPLVVSQSYQQPYIFFLFYLQYPPKKYQAQARLGKSPTSGQGDVGFVEKLDHITFRDIYWSTDQFKRGTIFAANPVTTIHSQESSDPQKFNLVSEINYPNGTPAFRVVEVL